MHASLACICHVHIYFYLLFILFSFSSFISSLKFYFNYYNGTYHRCESKCAWMTHVAIDISKRRSFYVFSFCGWYFHLCLYFPYPVPFLHHLCVDHNHIMLFCLSSSHIFHGDIFSMIPHAREQITHYSIGVSLIVQ